VPTESVIPGNLQWAHKRPDRKEEYKLGNIGEQS
jgi:hypothetical protein